MTTPEFRRPYLIQRCTVKQIRGEHPKKFSDLLSLDYMGSAEYEFGAVPACLRQMHSRFPLKLGMSEVAGKIVYVICSEAHYAPFVEWMQEIAEVKRNPQAASKEALWNTRLKESIRFWEALGVETPRFKLSTPIEDFWLDIDNGIGFGFDVGLVGAIPHLIAGSIEFMDAAKTK